jgi:hypothetical protein
MATALDIITDALIEIGAYASGQALSADDAALGLRRFQNQLDAWAADSLTLAVNEGLSYTLPSGANTFTIGPTGSVTAQRPSFIQAVNYVVPGSSPAVEVALGPMDDDQYNALSIKALSGGLPQEFYWNATTTNGTMFVWPTPNQSVVLKVYVLKAVDQPVSLTSTVIGPPAYAEAFMYQLAMRLCAPFQRPMTPDLMRMASVSYARIAVQNTEPGLLGVDSALFPSYGGAFNVLTGSFTGNTN